MSIKRASLYMFRQTDAVYRVHICNKTKYVRVVSFGIGMLEPTPEVLYNNIDELPEWMQEKLALLTMTSMNRPTKDVVGVGRRIQENIFWVYG